MSSLGEILRSRLFRRIVAAALLSIVAALCIGDTTTCANGTISARCVAKSRSGARANETTGALPARSTGSVMARQNAKAAPPALRPPGTALAREPMEAVRKLPPRPHQARASAPDSTGLIKRTAPARGLRGAAGFTVTVARGDTIDLIARRYGVEAAAIRAANQLGERASVWSGQRLVIPPVAAAT